jgi:hypothetical protein
MVSSLLIFVSIDAFGLETTQIDGEIASIQQDFNVQIHYTYDRDLFFPASWKSASNEMLAKQVELVEMARLLPIIRTFLSDHPLSDIHSDLDHIYVLAELSFKGRDYGSTYNQKSIYITCKDVESRYTEEFLAQRLHSEFSSILLIHPFPSRQWTQINPTDFRYSGTGFEVVHLPSRYDFSEHFCEDGFLLSYSKSSMENDFNMISSWLFTKKDALDDVSRRHGKISQKQALAEQFYLSISDQYRFD